MRLEVRVLADYEAYYKEGTNKIVRQEEKHFALSALRQALLLG